MANKTYFAVDYDNYSGAGCVRELVFPENDSRIQKERGGIYVLHDLKLGFSRVLYTDKKTAENVLLELSLD